MQLAIQTLIFFLILITESPINAENTEESHSASVAGMVKLVQLEANLIENLGSYAKKLEAKLDILKSVLPQLQAESRKAMTQSEDYVSNPLNAFSLIRRTHKDWDDWKIFMEQPVGSLEVAYINTQKPQLPTQTDILEACEAIYRLQMIYRLKPSDMSTGLINGKQYDASLNALDTYELGKVPHKNQQRDLAEEWFAETSKWLSKHTLPTPIGAERTKMLQLFFSAFLTYEYYSIALPIFDYAMRLQNKMDDPQILQKRAEIEKLAQEQPKAKPKPITKNYLFHQGCRGEFNRQSKLFCLYKTVSTPFLRLAPLKVEVVELHPIIFIFHDVLSSREMSELQKLARPSLVRTTVVKNGKFFPSKVRISKGVWFKRNLNNLTERIARRIVDMTDLDLEDSEPLQVMNYGIGGHYQIHNDFFNDSRLITPKDGDRIATVLFYLRDVEQGGATVFPKIRKAVSPKSGSALFWYNLHKNGTCDERTQHGGCPVLVGSKWIMTQWIRERRQLLSRPCGLRNP